MKLHATQLDRLIHGLINQYRHHDFIKVLRDDEQLKLAVERVLQQNFDEEEEIEKQARDLLESHTAGNNLDTHKAIHLIKQRLAQKRGFPL